MSITEVSLDLKSFSFRESIPFESAAEEQKQKHHGHAGVFALLFRDGPLKEFGDDFFHANSRLTDDAPPTLLVHLDQFPVDEFQWNVESLKALQSYNREGELPGPRGERTPRREIKPAHSDQSRGVVIFPGIHRS